MVKGEVFLSMVELMDIYFDNGKDSANMLKKGDFLLCKNAGFLCVNFENVLISHAMKDNELCYLSIFIDSRCLYSVLNCLKRRGIYQENKSDLNEIKGISEIMIVNEIKRMNKKIKRSDKIW